MIDVYTFCDNAPMETMGDRLKKARIQSGRFESARKAGQYFFPGTSGSTYMAHENGQNEYSAEDAARYAKAYRTTAGWLLTGQGPELPPEAENESSGRQVPLVGYVAAGSRAHFEPAGHLGEVDPGEIAITPQTVAVEVRGNSLGANWSGSKIFYDDRIDVPARFPELIGSLCIVGLDDGRILVKWLQKGSRRGRYHLVSETEPPIFDVKLEWAAKVRNVVPK